jgi:hypothetical protein
MKEHEQVLGGTKMKNINPIASLFKRRDVEKEIVKKEIKEYYLKQKKDSIDWLLLLKSEGWIDTGKRQSHLYMMRKGTERCLYDYSKAKVVAKYEVLPVHIKPKDTE